jgi:SpoVK/Ycf46/Vps4 family AAA+-type ATPase
LGALLERVVNTLPASVQVNLNGSREAVLKSLLGLTAFEAESVLLSGVAASGGLDESVISFVVKEKAQIIRRSGVLEFFDTSLTMKDVGGLGNLKRYANVKLGTFSEKAREYGLDPAKGVLLVGVPGTGKSLTAKAIAGGRFPLLRLDVGALMGSLVGQSESNMRQALQVAEAVSPCILWVDEIEKALGGINGGESDGGTTKRVFGTFLTWMSEKTAPVYIIATANDIRSLPAELFRAGRFDDIYFVDLPNHEDRASILDVHLTKRGRQYTTEFAPVIKATWGMTGAEIEKVVTSALECAFLENRDIRLGDLMFGVSQVNPIAKTMKDQIDTLRNWARTRAHWAGTPLEQEPETTGERMVELT